MNSYVAELLNKIALQMNKSPESVKPFIEILESNWIESEDQLR